MRVLKKSRPFRVVVLAAAALCVSYAIFSFRSSSRQSASEFVRIGDKHFIVPSSDILMYFPPSSSDGGSLLLRFPWPHLGDQFKPGRSYFGNDVDVKLTANPRLNAGQRLLDSLRGIYDESHVVRRIGNYDVYQWPVPQGRAVNIDPTTGLRWGLDALYISTVPAERGFFMECDIFAGPLSAKYPSCQTSLAWVGAHTDENPRLNSSGYVVTVRIPKPLLTSAKADVDKIVKFVSAMEME